MLMLAETTKSRRLPNQERPASISYTSRIERSPIYLPINFTYIRSVFQNICSRTPLPRQYDIFESLLDDQCVLGRQNCFSHWYNLLGQYFHWPRLTDIEQERARASDWQLRNYLRHEELKLLIWTFSLRPLEIDIP
jgi:hypothetical protein